MTAPGSPAGSLERVYKQFATYSCPGSLWVCPVCGPQFSAEDICSTPLRSVSFAQLDAVHVASLDDDGLRYFIPRLLELLIVEPSPWFDFRLSDLRGRLPAWHPAESVAVSQLLAAVWREVLRTYPPSGSYLSDCPSMLSFAAWCDIPPTPFLNEWQWTAPQAARHLADLISYVFSKTKPFEPDITETVLSWLRQPAIGEWLQEAFFLAEDEEAGRQLSVAHEVWSVCIS